MKITIVSPKITPPWDSAIASFSWAITKAALLSITNDTIDEINIFTRKRSLTMYQKTYQPSSDTFRAIQDDTNLFFEELKIVKPRLNYMKKYESNENKNNIYILIEPQKNEVLNYIYKGFLNGNQINILKLYKYKASRIVNQILNNKIKIYRTYANPVENDFIPCGVNTAIFNPKSSLKNKNGKRLKAIIDELRNHNDYVFSFLGPIFGQRMSLIDTLKIISKLKNNGIRVGVIGFITIRHTSDIDYTNLMIDKMKKNRLWRKNIWIEARVISTYEKIALCNYTDMFLYPIIEPVELSDPPISVLEYAACKKPTVTLNYGLLGKLYVPNKCLYKNYSIENVTSTVKRCLNSDDYELQLLRTIVNKYFSLNALGNKLKNLFEIH